MEVFLSNYLCISIKSTFMNNNHKKKSASG